MTSARLVLANLWVAITAFALGGMMAVMQALARAGVELPFGTARLYYLSVTAHGVLEALVFTTFFIMALGYLVTETTMQRIAGPRWAWAGFWVALVGTAITTVAILSGTSTVLYTFYPPLLAHPAFYIGATLLVVGSWIWCGVMIASYRSWRRDHPAERIPLAAHGMLTTVAIWILATAGLAVEVLVFILPWSLGLVARIDPIVARTYFWWFGHPLTYFWLVPAYVLWYTVIPRVAGGKLFSDGLTRVVFVQFILFSTPVGFHHQFTDPGIAGGWKLLHTFTTYAIMFPSLVTAFTVIASLEHAGRARGGTGRFGWIPVLPWRDPFFAGVALSMVTFALGGFGGAINAAYAMNAMIHNTAWVQGHFHLTVGHGGGAHLHGQHLLDAAAADRARHRLSAPGDAAALSVVRRHAVLQHPQPHRRPDGHAAARLHRRVPGRGGGAGVDPAGQPLGGRRRDPVRVGDVLRRRRRRHDARGAARRARRRSSTPRPWRRPRPGRRSGIVWACGAPWRSC